MGNNSIVITPVQNGFVVYLPETHSADDIHKIGNMIVGMSRKLQQEELMGKPMQDDAEHHTIERQFNRDKNCHVFATFPEVLAFLKVTFD